MLDDYYQVLSGPLAEPVTLAEAKSHLRITHNADDTLISSMITAARIFGQKYCNRIFTETSILCQFGGVDVSNFETYQFIQVRRCPLISINSLEIYTGGAYTVSTDYLLKDSNGFPRILFNNGIESDNDAIYPIQITASFGYQTVPEDLKAAVLCHVAFLYENRGDVAATYNVSMPHETKSIYSGKYRIINTF